MLDSAELMPEALDVLIVGAGPCGLAMAISVSLAGHMATVFEAWDKPHHFGAGLQCSPNGTRLLSRWDVDDILKAVAVEPTAVQLRGLDGRLLAQREGYDQEVHRRYRSPLWNFSRIDLQAGLLRRALELGVKVHFLSRVTDIDDLDPSIELASGERRYGDLVVVADGRNSALRPKVLVEASDPQPMGEMAYRITVGRAHVQDKELLSMLDMPQLRLWPGQDFYAVGYSTRGCDELNFLLLLPDNFSRGDSTTSAIAEETKKHVQGKDPLLATMLEAAGRINRWQPTFVPPPPTCLSPRRTCVLAGDSCRSLNPMLSQSLNLGLEDAATLGSVLGHVTSRKQLTGAIELYDQLRTSRTRSVLGQTKSHEYELRFVGTCTGISLSSERAGGPDYGGDWPFSKSQDQIWKYDAYEEAEKAYLINPY